MGTIREGLAQSVGRLKGARVLLTIAMLAGLLVEAPDAEARQCRINITASGPFQGEVVDQGGGPFTRNAIEVTYKIGDIALRANQVENPRGRIHFKVGNEPPQPLRTKVARKRPMQAKQHRAAGMMLVFVLHT